MTAGASATRRSPGKTSLGTPMIISLPKLFRSDVLEARSPSHPLYVYSRSPDGMLASRSSPWPSASRYHPGKESPMGEIRLPATSPDRVHFEGSQPILRVENMPASLP